jgi:hypothetical protein
MHQHHHRSFLHPVAPTNWGDARTGSRTVFFDGHPPAHRQPRIRAQAVLILLLRHQVAPPRLLDFCRLGVGAQATHRTHARRRFSVLVGTKSSARCSWTMPARLRPRARPQLHLSSAAETGWLEKFWLEQGSPPKHELRQQVCLPHPSQAVLTWEETRSIGQIKCHERGWEGLDTPGWGRCQASRSWRT